MYRNAFLHHFISLIIFSLYYTSTTYLLKFLPAPVEGFQLTGVLGILLLYVILPVMLYTFGNWLLLTELGAKGEFKTLLWQNSVVIGVLYVVFFAWFIVGDAIKDPTSYTMVIIWLLYGVLMLAIVSVGVLYLQCLHAMRNWKKTNKVFVKHWLYAMYWLIGTVLAVVIWVYLPILPPTITEAVTFGLLVLYVAAYTQWQQKLYSSLGLI